MANRDLFRRAVRYALFANATALAATPAVHAAATTAAADTTTEQPVAVSEVVITVSRLPEPGLTSVSPVTSISSVDIQQQGSTRIEDLLNTLPQVFGDQG